VLLLHALTGSPEAGSGKGWWAPLLAERGPLGPSVATVLCPNLPGSCYGSIGPKELSPFPAITPRDQASALAAWLEASNLSFDLCIGGSLGGMVALELALRAPGRTGAIAVMGCGGRADAWIRASCHAQRRILESGLADAEALALARQVAMPEFRSPESLDARFGDANGEGAEAGSACLGAGGAGVCAPARNPRSIEAWLDHHGEALAARFHRGSLHTLLGAMAAFDLGRDRGGLAQALRGLAAPLHLLGIRSDQLFVPALLEELAEAAEQAQRLGSLHWLDSPHGHDAFLMEWDSLAAWLQGTVLPHCGARIAS
jgi:homoserine O-acetyltransferase